MAGKNTLARKIATKMIFPDIKHLLDTTVSFDQGDLLCLIGGLVKKASAETDGATFLGIAPVTVVAGKFPSVYHTDVDASAAVGAMVGPEYGDVHKVMLKAGDSLAAGDVVYLNPTAGGRGVQASGTKAIGVYQGKAVTAPTGGLEIEVLIGCRYPADALHL